MACRLHRVYSASSSRFFFFFGGGVLGNVECYRVCSLGIGGLGVLRCLGVELKAEGPFACHGPSTRLLRMVFYWGSLTVTLNSKP